MSYRYSIYGFLLAAATTPLAAKMQSDAPEVIYDQFRHVERAPDKIGGTGAPSSLWAFPGSPSVGFDTVSATFVPIYAGPLHKSHIYWAYSSAFVNGTAWYMGLQPNARDGHKVLFSVFGQGASSTSANCKQGADGGPGTRCHMAYPWKYNHSYTMKVELIGEADDTRTWRGWVRDDTTGESTIVGDISVQKSRGLLRTRGSTFSEFYYRSIPCADRPGSEVLLHSIKGELKNKTYDAKLGTLNANGGPGGCNPSFYTDGKTYVYMRQGGFE